MAKELYIYSSIYSYAMESANIQLDNFSSKEDITVRFNSPGGETNSGFAFLSKLSEKNNKKIAIVDGQAKSMAAYLLPFFDTVIVNDTSELMFHKAAYPTWFKPNEAQLQSLKRTNQKFEEKMKAKVRGKDGADDFLNKLFEPDVRNDVELTPEEAKKLGIVDEIRVLEVKAFANMQIVALAENGELVQNIVSKNYIEKNSNQNNNQKMTIEKFKSENPSLYAQILEDGRNQGVTAERDRVGAWLAFIDIDSEAVAKGIKDGNDLSQTSMAEFTAKGIKAARMGDHEEDNADGINTDSGSNSNKKNAQSKEAEEALDKLNLKK